MWAPAPSSGALQEAKNEPGTLETGSVSWGDPTLPRTSAEGWALAPRTRSCGAREHCHPCTQHGQGTGEPAWVRKRFIRTAETLSRRCAGQLCPLSWAPSPHQAGLGCPILAWTWCCVPLLPTPPLRKVFPKKHCECLKGREGLVGPWVWAGLRTPTRPLPEEQGTKSPAGRTRTSRTPPSPSPPPRR